MGHEIAHLDVKDIYFLIDLSQHGEPIILKEGGRGGDNETVYEYIVSHCRPRSRKRNN